MTALNDYFDYPHRRPGLDHDRFPHRYLRDAKPVIWPGGARIALWLTVDVAHFPMDMDGKPFLPPGGMSRMPPCVWDYTLRDYSNRVGIYRVLKVLDRHGVKATAATSGVIAERYPSLLADLAASRWEFMANGLDMKQLHYGGLDPESERRQVETALQLLRDKTGQPVVGWHSPAHNESAVTPDLVAGAGCRYIADWINDDMPYRLATSAGSLVQMPLTYDFSDKRVLFTQNQSLAEWEGQVLAAFDFLYDEAASQGGRILSLSLAPWVIGQPYRIGALDRVLTRILARPGVWVATGAEIADAWIAGGGE